MDVGLKGCRVQGFDLARRSSCCRGRDRTAPSPQSWSRAWRRQRRQP